MRVEPEDGSPPFEVTKKGRARVPAEAGDRYPVFYEDAKRSNWVYGTQMDPERIDPELRELFELAAQAEAEERYGLKTERP